MYTIPAFSCAVLNVARASGVNGLTIDCIGAENPSEIIPSLGPSGLVEGTGPAMVLVEGTGPAMVSGVEGMEKQRQELVGSAM